MKIGKFTHADAQINYHEIKLIPVRPYRQAGRAIKSSALVLRPPVSIFIREGYNRLEMFDGHKLASYHQY